MFLKEEILNTKKLEVFSNQINQWSVEHIKNVNVSE